MIATKDKNENEKPQLRVTLFTDYICPFCFIGDLRLQHLRNDYDVLVNFRFIEIHPETSVKGATINSLDYSDKQWQDMMDGLMEMVEEEEITLAPVCQLANSHRALLLAEAAKTAGREVFYRLNQSLYQNYFVEGRDIGDAVVLRQIAGDCGVSDDIIEKAWSDSAYEKILLCLFTCRWYQWYGNGSEGGCHGYANIFYWATAFNRSSTNVKFEKGSSSLY